MILLDSNKNKKGGGPSLRMILCLALLFLFSCEDDSTLGLGFDPDDENIRIIEKEFVLPTAVVLLDSVNATLASRFLVGKYQNDELGTVRAASYNNFGLSAAAIPDDIVYDSTVLTLENTYWYGDGNPENIPHTISVHVLQDTLGRDLRYTNEQMPYESVPIGMRTYLVNREPSEEDGEADNLVRIRIDDAVGEDLLDKLQNEADEVSTNAKFQEYFKGIAIVSDESNVLMHGYATPATDFSIYYHVDGDTTIHQYSFVLNQEVTIQFNGIYSDRSGTSLAGLTIPREDFKPENGKFYIQAGAGIVAKVNFAPFVEFMEQTANSVVINRAEFSISTDIPGEYSPSLSGLVPYLVKEDNKRIVVIDFSGTPSFKTINDELSQSQNPLVLSPDTVDNNLVYQGVMTVYTQSLLNTSIEQNVLLFPGQLSTSINHLQTDTSRVKLKVQYTTLK